MTSSLNRTDEDSLQGSKIAAGGPEGGDVHGPRAGWRLAMSSFIENKLALAGSAIVVFFIGFCFLGPHLYHTNQISTNIVNSFEPPGAGHPLGTDGNGFDQLGRIMVGGQSALRDRPLLVGHRDLDRNSGRRDRGVGRRDHRRDSHADRGRAPFYPDPARSPDRQLALRRNRISALSHHRNLFLAGIGQARAWRGLSLRVRDFVLAARTMGASRTRLIYKHLIPNAMSVVIVNTTFQVADAIGLLALLGFLGFGLNYPSVDWGDMLSGGLEYLQDGYWWLVYPVGACLVLVIMAFNFIGDALRDTVDARLRQR